LAENQILIDWIFMWTF